MIKSIIQVCLLITTLGLQATAQCTYSVNIISTDATCFGTASGSATASTVGGTGPFSFQWNSSPPQSGPNATNLTAGNYSVTITDGLNCITSTQVTIDQPGNLNVDLGSPQVLCQGNPVTFASVISGGTAPYTYFWTCLQGNCGISDPASPSPSITPSTSGQYILQITDANGCGGSDYLPVTVREQPSVDAGVDKNLFAGDDTQLAATASAAGTFSWSPASGLDNPLSQNPVAAPGASTVYTVTFTDSDGCKAFDEIAITVDMNVALPTGLTPNGDNINDNWSLKGANSYPGIKSEVFNRNGDRVYLAFNGDEPWDGTYNGNPLPAGTYFFVINLGDGSEPMKGHLTLIR